MSLENLLKSLEEKLTFKKEAVIGGITFEITLLTYEQDQLINSIPDDGDDPLAYYEKSRTQILSYALNKINGEGFPRIIEVKDGDNTITKEKAIYVREILKNIPQKVVDKLFEIYIDFRDETDTRLTNEVEYKWYKTPEQRKKERDDKEKEEKEKEEAKKAASESEVVVPEASEIPPEDKPIVFTKIEVKDEETPQVG